MPAKCPRKNPPSRRDSSAKTTYHSTGQAEDTAEALNTQTGASMCNTNDGLTTRERLTSQLYQSLLGNGIIALIHPPGPTPSYFLIQGVATRPSYSVTPEAVSRLVDTVVTRWINMGKQSLFDFNLFGEELEGSLKELVDGILNGDVGEGAILNMAALPKAKKLWV